MMFKTHLSSSISLGLAPFVFVPELSQVIGLQGLQFYIGGLMLGAGFPDIDEAHSAVSRKVNKVLPFVPHLINFLFGHRGITHRFIFFLAFLFLSLLINALFKNTPYGFILFILSLAFSLGILFHQIGDMLAGSKRFKGGIRAYFFPIINDYTKYSTPFPYIIRCSVGGFKEHIYFLAFSTAMLYEIYLVFIVNILKGF